MRKTRIVIATGCLCGYPQGGGVWAWVIQYLQGLRALGHRVFLIDVTASTMQRRLDDRRVAVFLARLDRLGFRGQAAVLVKPSPQTIANSLSDFAVYGVSEQRLSQEIRESDVLWNLAWGALSPQVRQCFKRSVLLDVDPGQLQVSALAWDMQLDEFDVRLTSGVKINDPDCEIPKLGLAWQPFFQPVYVPEWGPSVAPSIDAPVTSVTQWNWAHEFRLGDRVFSDSKRDAYLRYLDMPRQLSTPFLLAANIHPSDKTGDIQILENHGWTLVSPHRVAGTPRNYANFIRSSLCEFSCAKPIYVELRTGWFSERSAAYLASGRPVIAQDTGFSDHMETGRGLLAFSDMHEAAAAIHDVIGNYSIHQQAAREIADAYFSHDRVLPNLIEASF